MAIQWSQDLPEFRPVTGVTRCPLGCLLSGYLAIGWILEYQCHNRSCSTPTSGYGVSGGMMPSFHSVPRNHARSMAALTVCRAAIAFSAGSSRRGVQPEGQTFLKSSPGATDREPPKV